MKIGLVCTHGGHLTQILKILEAFDGHELFFVTHSSSRDGDVCAIAPAYFCKNIGVRLHLFIWTVAWAFFVLAKEKPQVIFSTGAEIAIPFFVWAKVLGIKTIFLESWSRVSHPSRTGQLLYPLADEFLVQWPGLVSVYGSKAKYFGAVI